MASQFPLVAAVDFALFSALLMAAFRSPGKGAARHKAYFALMAAPYFVSGALGLYGGGFAARSHPAYPALALFSALLFSFFASEAAGLKSLKPVSLALSLSVFFAAGPAEFWRTAYLAWMIVCFLSFFVLYEFSFGRTKHAGLLGLVAAAAAATILFAGVPGATAERFWFVPNIFLFASYAMLAAFGADAGKVMHSRRGSFSLDDTNASFSQVARPLFHLIVYLSLLNVVVMLGALALHEAGHLWIGSRMSCTGEAVLFDSSDAGPYTSLSCPPGTPEVPLALAGFVFLIPFSAIFFVLRGYPERNLGLVIFGLALVMGALDMKTIILSKPALYAFMLLGVITACIGEVLLINAYLSPEKKHSEKTTSS